MHGRHDPDSALPLAVHHLHHLPETGTTVAQKSEADRRVERGTMSGGSHVAGAGLRQTSDRFVDQVSARDECLCRFFTAQADELQAIRAKVLWQGQGTSTDKIAG